MALKYVLDAQYVHIYRVDSFIQMIHRRRRRFEELFPDIAGLAIVPPVMDQQSKLFITQTLFHVHKTCALHSN